jgi:uncharacterized membrane protein
MENVVLSFFKVESEAYQALSEIKRSKVSEKDTILSQVVLFEKVDGKVIVKDGFDTGSQTSDDTLLGGLIGGVLGLLGGPIGILLGMSIGAGFGSLIDNSDAKNEDGLLYTVSTRMKDGDIALIAVIQEESESPYNRIINQFDTVIIRYRASDIQEELDHARQVQKDLQHETKVRMKEKRSKERRIKMDEYSTKFKEEFKHIKEKFTLTHSRQ